MTKYEIGDSSNGDEVLEIKELSNNLTLIRTEGYDSDGDFKVKLVNDEHPIGVTVKHAHFAIDFYGKLRYDEELGGKILQALIDVWHGQDVNQTLESWQDIELPGYPLDYVFHGMNWITEQEDINFDPDKRDDDKQAEIDQILNKQKVTTPQGRKGSELAISLFCDIANGTHPVEAFYRVNLRI